MTYIYVKYRIINADPSTVGTELSRGQRRTICILLGMVRLLSGEWAWFQLINNYFNYLYSVGPYLIVGTAHREVGSIDNQKIFEMTRYELIPFLTSTLHLTQSQVHTLPLLPYMELGIIWYVSIYRKETIGYSLP